MDAENIEGTGSKEETTKGQSAGGVEHDDNEVESDGHFYILYCEPRIGMAVRTEKIPKRSVGSFL